MKQKLGLKKYSLIYNGHSWLYLCSGCKKCVQSASNRIENKVLYLCTRSASRMLTIFIEQTYNSITKHNYACTLTHIAQSHAPQYHVSTSSESPSG